jgi:hypothetical protein
VNRGQRKTLAALFVIPARSDVRWAAAESLLGALGAVLSERAGSRVAVSLATEVAVFHRPHPGPHMDRGAVKDLRRFLENAGVRP